MLERGKSVRFASFVRSWLSTWASVRLKGAAYQGYEAIVRLHLLPEFGDLGLTDITPERIQSWVASTVSGGCARTTARNRLIVLKRVLETAVDYGLLERNPVAAVAFPRVERPEMRFLVASELHRLIEAAPASWRLLITMAATTGLRKGEQLALTFGDIDLEELTIRVSKSMRAGVVTSPKTAGSVNVIPLPGSLGPLIAQRSRQVADPDGLIFCRRDGSPLPDSLPNRILARALEEAGLQPIRWHDLRHSWVVAHLQAGTDIPTLQRLGRWSSPETLLRTYAHVLPAAGGDAVANLDRMISEHDR
jgi:integrase